MNIILKTLEVVYKCKFVKYFLNHDFEQNDNFFFIGFPKLERDLIILKKRINQDLFRYMQIGCVTSEKSELN